MFHLRINQVVDFSRKMFEKYLWKRDILSKDSGHRPASLLKMSLFYRSFSNILLRKTNYLVSTLVEHRINKHLRHKLNSGNYCVYWCHYDH